MSLGKVLRQSNNFVSRRDAVEATSLTSDFTVEMLERRFLAADGASFSSPAAPNLLLRAFTTDGGS